MPNEDPRLKPCPFCGDDEAPLVVVRRGKDGWRDRFLVLCDYEHGGCGGSSGWYHYEPEAVGAWNRRATSADVEPKRRWIPVTERLPECEVGAEIGNVEWIIHDMVFAGCFGRGGKYRDAYFRTWTDTTEGIDAKDADCWRVVTLPEPPKEEDHAKDGPDKAD